MSEEIHFEHRMPTHDNDQEMLKLVQRDDLVSIQVLHRPKWKSQTRTYNIKRNTNVVSLNIYYETWTTVAVLHFSKQNHFENLSSSYYSRLFPADSVVSHAGDTRTKKKVQSAPNRRATHVSHIWYTRRIWYATIIICNEKKHLFGFRACVQRCQTPGFEIAGAILCV